MTFKIGKKNVGSKFQPLIIVEIGINHNGSIREAKKLVDSAKKAGAEIIKHQTHVLDDEMAEEAKKITPSHTKETIYEIMKKCALNEKDDLELMRYVKKLGMIYISTPFSKLAVDRLVKFKVPAFKIGSGECNNYPLIEYIAKKKKPIILSTGMNTIKTIKPAVQIFRKFKVPYALLHCTNIYPTPTNQVRLDALDKLKSFFPDAVLGLSDHSTTIYPCLGAIAKGASIVEKHFTDNKKRKGPDISASMDTFELKELLKGSKEIFLAKGDYKGPVKGEKSTIDFAFASIVSTQDIYPGQKLTKENIFPKRPGIGDFLAKDYKKLLGAKSKKFIGKNLLIKKRDIKLNK